MAVTGLSSSFSGTTLVIPPSINGKPVRRVTPGAFQNNAVITSVSIPEGVTSVGDFAFNGCGKLRNVTLPPSLTALGSYAFAGCTALSAITLPAGIQTIAEGTFSAAGITGINLPSGTTAIGSYAFFGSKLTAIAIPAGVKTIAPSAFAYSSLKSVLLPPGLISIQDQAFAGCGGLTSIVLPPGLKSIGVQALAWAGLANITIPASVTFLAPDVLRGNGKLLNIAVDSSNPAYAALGGVLFNKALTVLLLYPQGRPGASYIVPGSVLDIGAFAFEESKLTFVNLPPSLRSIGDSAFAGFRGTSILLPQGLLTIGSNAFSESSLVSVEIPSTVRSVGPRAFFDATNLKIVRFLGDAPTVSGNSFGVAGTNGRPALVVGFGIQFLSGAAGFSVPTWNGFPATNTLPVATFLNTIGDLQPGNGTQYVPSFPARNGFLSITTASSGNFTGNLRIEGQSLPLSGRFGANGTASVIVPRPGLSSNASLSLAFNPATPGLILGNLTTSGPAIPVGLRVGIQPDAPRRYTVALASPDNQLGHGYASVSISANGSATISGLLADSSPLAGSTQMTSDGQQGWILPIHIPSLANPLGVVTGWLVVEKVDNVRAADIWGQLRWLRPPNSSAATFKNGFLYSLLPVGEKFTPTTGVSALTGNATDSRFILTKDPSSIRSSRFDLAGTWSKANAIVVAKPSTVLFNSATGTISGNFTQTIGAQKTSTPFNGVIFSRPLVIDGMSSPCSAAGFYPVNGLSGKVEMRLQP